MVYVNGRFHRANRDTAAEVIQVVAVVIRVAGERFFDQVRTSVCCNSS